MSSTTATPLPSVSDSAVTPAPQQDFDADSILADVVKIDGAIGATLVHAASGAVLGEVAVGRGVDMGRAAKIAQDIIQAAFRFPGEIDDIMITADKHYHLIRVLDSGEELFVHLILDRERASLGMARQQLAKLARQRSP